MNKNFLNSNFNLLDKIFVFKILKNPWNFNFFIKKENILILEVDLKCNKIIIKKSVEFIFGIKVLKINVIIKKYSIYKNKNLKYIKKKKAYVKFIN